MLERWVPVEGFEKYEVSNFARVRSLSRNVPIKTRANNQGIEMINLMDSEGRIKTRSLGLTVARAFLEPPENETYTSVIHLNGDKSNCLPENLMWRPRWYAVMYHKQFLRKSYGLCKIRCVQTGKHYDSYREASVDNGVIEEHIYIAVMKEMHVGMIPLTFERDDHHEDRISKNSFIIDGHRSWLINSKGEVLNRRSRDVKAQYFIGEDGDCYVDISDDGNGVNVKELMRKYFLPKRREPGCVLENVDGNPFNNAVDNLRWVYRGW